jgi:predicted DNA-binding transcriptional regulator AlpA
MRTGSFPASIKLTGKAVGWRESWIERWIDERQRTVQRVA